ncbi:MAG: CPBP family intramembrane glutamic endopeptidase [Candidatus Andersenbacteria bacterium]
MRSGDLLEYFRSDPDIISAGPARRRIQYACLAILCISAVALVALQMKFAGYTFLILGAVLLPLTPKVFARNMFLVFFSLGILGLTPITTDVSYTNFVRMGLALGAAVIIPYIVSRYIYQDYLVRFRFHHGRKWFKKEILYIFFTVVVAYVLLPFYLRDTGAYLNWSVEPGFGFLTRLFIGTNGLGIWDELFFVSTVLGIFRRFFSFLWANVAQAVLFTSFLYELGFTGWGFVMIFIFALIQGVVFRQTDSLLYVITIHLALDFVLYLALIHAHHPGWLPIFLL